MKISSIVQTPCTHDLDASLNFYRNLGFNEVGDSDSPRFSDGELLISINPERTARTAIRLFGAEEDAISKLKEQTSLFGDSSLYHCADPNGVQVFLEPADEFDIPEDKHSSLGKFAGMSIEATDFSRTLGFWNSLGYEKNMGDETQGWLTLERPGWVGISLMKAGMCPHLFYSPGFTYFNSGKNVENIAKIREAGIPITEEIDSFNSEGIVDNVIIRDPGGSGFFVFND